MRGLHKGRPFGGRGLGALAGVLALAACANPERGQFLLPLDAIEPGAGPIELGEGFDDAPGAIMSAVIAGDLLVGGQAASRMAGAPSATPEAGGAAGQVADAPVVVTGDEAALAAQRQTAFERMTTEQREARLRQVDQDLLLERWMRTRVAPLQLSRADIRRAQELLAQLGFDPGPVDGLMGPRTRTAVESFEQAQGLPASGEMTPALIDRMALEI